MGIKTADRKRINPGPALDGNFIPRWLFKRSEISPGAKAVYSELARLMTDDGRLQTDRITIARRLGIFPKHLDRYLKELKRCGLIGIKRCGQGHPNSYFFFQHKWMEFEPGEAIILNEPPLAFPDFPKPEILISQNGKSDEIPQRKRQSSQNGKSGDSLFLYSSILKRDLKKEVSEIVEKINSLSGKHYKATSKSIVKFLIARMEDCEDANLKNCLLVVGHRWQKWGHSEKMFENFNPVTIFRKANFEKYLVEALAMGDGVEEWEPPEVRAMRQ